MTVREFIAMGFVILLSVSALVWAVYAYTDGPEQSDYPSTECVVIDGECE